MGILRVSVADMVRLGVRARGKGDCGSPDLLFQQMPERALALMATIPEGPVAVSIPGFMGAFGGWPIRTNAPSAPGGFVVIYRRRRNNQYEAESVQRGARTFEYGRFVLLARRWLARNHGIIRPVPGRYSYLCPSVETWGGVLRDSGYVAWDPEGMPADMTPELQAEARSPGSCGLVIRTQVFSGVRKDREEILPVFARVEVLCNCDAAIEGRWVGFDEYRSARDERARVPEGIIPGFHRWLEEWTVECGFRKWVFQPGMLFGDQQEWWGERNQRRTEHEGMDFAVGLDAEGNIRGIIPGSPVRNAFEGDVFAVLDDFLGKTLIIRHPFTRRPDGYVFHSLFSHVQPCVNRYDQVQEGRIVGSVAKSRRAAVPSHLHFGGAWIPSGLSGEDIKMDHLHPAFEPVLLVDFKDLLRKSTFGFFDEPDRKRTE